MVDIGRAEFEVAVMHGLAWREPSGPGRVLRYLPGPKGPDPAVLAGAEIRLCVLSEWHVSFGGRGCCVSSRATGQQELWLSFELDLGQRMEELGLLGGWTVCVS